MKIETVARDDQQTQLIAELDAETLEKYRHQAARKISKNQKIPGFRPGKAPYDLIRRMYGDEAITQEAIELMLDEVYPQVLKEANIEPSGPGKLEEIVSYDPPKFSFVIPLKPEVNLGEYSEIRKDYEPEPITEEQVETTLLRLQRSYATAEPVERPAQAGDMVSFKLSANRANPEEGESATLVEATPYQMIAGEDNEVEEEVWPYEGFTDELIGLSANDTKTVTHTFSDESPYEDLQGKETIFIIEVDNVKELHLPELNDEFAQNLGEFENVEDLRKAIRTQLEQNYKQEYDQNYFDELIEELVDQATVKYPPHMLDEEVEEFLQGVEHNLEHDRLDLETYLKMREMDRETFIDQEVKPAAQRRLLRSLVLEEFARQENIEVQGDEIRSIYFNALQRMQQTQEMGNVKSRNKKSSQELANSIAINTVNTIFNQRMMSRLKAIATGIEEETAAQAEVEQPETEQEPEAVAVEGIEPSAEQQPEAQEESSDAPKEQIPPESEAALEFVESSAPTSAAGAEEEVDITEDTLLTEEPPQADKNAGEGES